MNIFLHEQPRTGAANMTLVEEDTVDDSLDGLIHCRVIENNVGSLATQLKRESLLGTGNRFSDLPSNSR